MKKIFFAVLMTFVMIGLSSCSRKMELSGTTWVGNHSMQFDDVDMDEPVELEFTSTIKFTSSKDGVIQFEIFGQTEDQPFTYTCDGDGNGVINGVDEDDGSTMESSFSIKDDKLTIVEDGESFEFVKQ